MTIQQEIELKNKEFREKGLVFFKQLNKNVRVVAMSWAKGDKTVSMELKHGFGADEKREDLSFHQDEFYNYMALFEDKRELGKDSNPEVKPKITITKSADMQEENHNNNLSELRKILFDSMRKVERGELAATEAKAISGIAQTIINSAKLEMEYKRSNNKDKPTNIPMLNE